MPTALIFGGTGYIGMNLAESLVADAGIRVVLADIKPPEREIPGVSHVHCDVRKPIDASLFAGLQVDWIFNFAAIHREPGHAAHEYYDTNLAGAENVCALAEAIGCDRILFSSSISVYGPTPAATSEQSPKLPNTPYGVTKLIAEYMHREWLARGASRKLVIVRPGVIYGPADPGNILRMIRAVKRGYFVLPTASTIKKSYGYIYGLIDSMRYAMSLPEPLVIYNYVERETMPLGQMIATINEVFGSKGRLIRAPMGLLVLAARLIQSVNPNLNGIHPDRVRKVARPTHIVPGFLIERGFDFRYDFKSSLEHWKQARPSDF